MTSAIPNWKKQLPTQVTLSRILFGFVIAYLYSVSSPWMGWVTGLLFIVAALTDYLDGILARRWNAESNMGKLMDPVADKILVLAALLALFKNGQVDLWLILLLVNRDLFIGALRSVAAVDNVVIAAGTSGKWKTALQLVAVPCLLIRPEILRPYIEWLGYGLLWFSVGLSLLSAVQYTLLYYKNQKPQKI